MGTDYSTALAGLAASILLFSGMVIFALSRPSDLSRHSQ